MRVHEIFNSIEGEGTSTGIPTTFICLQGCSVRCQLCDTYVLQNPNLGKDMTLEEILQACLKPHGDKMVFASPRISITGGNPCDQMNDVVCLAELMFEYAESNDLRLPWLHLEHPGFFSYNPVEPSNTNDAELDNYKSALEARVGGTGSPNRWRQDVFEFFRTVSFGHRPPSSGVHYDKNESSVKAIAETIRFAERRNHVSVLDEDPATGSHYKIPPSVELRCNVRNQKDLNRFVADFEMAMLECYPDNTTSEPNFHPLHVLISPDKYMNIDAVRQVLGTLALHPLHQLVFDVRMSWPMHRFLSVIH